MRRLSLAYFLVPAAALLCACPDNGPPAQPDAGAAAADAAPPMADAAPPPPDARIRYGYGESCTDGNDCLSGLCVGSDNDPWTCSRYCTLDVANDCKDVNAFCVPIGGNDHACWGAIDTGSDADDAILSIGDAATRAVTPLGDADLFLVHLDQLGTAQFEVEPGASIDVQLEAYGVLGDALGIANDGGPGVTERLQTDVQQIGGHIFMVVRNVGTSTGTYTLRVTHVD